MSLSRDKWAHGVSMSVRGVRRDYVGLITTSFTVLNLLAGYCTFIEWEKKRSVISETKVCVESKKAGAASMEPTNFLITYLVYS